jgi:hypothetical protein
MVRCLSMLLVASIPSFSAAALPGEGGASAVLCANGDVACLGEAVSGCTTQLRELSTRVETAERQAQGAERNANAAETRTAQTEGRLAAAEDSAAAASSQAAEAKKRAEEADKKAQAADERAKKISLAATVAVAAATVVLALVALVSLLRELLAGLSERAFRKWVAASTRELLARSKAGNPNLLRVKVPDLPYAMRARAEGYLSLEEGTGGEWALSLPKTA